MTASRNSSSLQLFDQVFSDESQREKYADLNAFLEAGGSVFPLVEKGVQGLVRDYGLSASDAQAYLERANALAIYVRRQFIEQRPDDASTLSGQPQSGLLSLIPGPSYEKLFPKEFNAKCPPQALESLFSPVAYLIELLRWVRDRIEPAGDVDDKMPLMERRTDLEALSIDYNAVYQAVPSVEIIVPVLETFIKAHADDVTNPEAAMTKARYPNGLPYYQDWATIDFVARKHDLSVGDFAYAVNPSFPYFLQPNAWDSDAGRALLHASRLGPHQRTLLTEPLWSSGNNDAREKFYEVNFGATGVAWQNLNQVPFFCERTKLDLPGLEALLSIQSFAPVRSANAFPPGDSPTPANGLVSGSVYLNGGGAAPITIVVPEGGPAFTHRLSEDVNNPARYDRINRKVRLDNWLKKPPEQVDALVMAAIRAENGALPAMAISDHTVQALGLFQLLRERYGCPAEDFAAFIGDMSVYGRGEQLSQFDRVFNVAGDLRGPLQLDGEAFDALPPTGQVSLTISRLCNGLSIDLRTYQYLALAIAQAHGNPDKLARTPAIISSFYRLVKLPRLLQITPAEGVLMLLLLGGTPWLNALAGRPAIKTDPVKGPPDVLNIIVAMESCVAWCRECDLPVLWMLQHVAPPVAKAAPSADDLQLFGQVRNLLTGALFSNTLLQIAGVPLPVGLDWLDLLGSVVDSDGLVLSPAGLVEADYPAFARARLASAVKEGLGEGDAVEQAAIVEKMFSVLMQARSTQTSVAKECVAVYAGLESALVPAVLEWSNIGVHQLLRQVLDRTSGLETATLGPNAEDDTELLLMLLADLRRRSAVVVELQLSADLLRDYLDYGYQAWVGQADKCAFTLSTLYFLTVLTRAFALSDQPPARLLDYLREVHALPDPLGGHATELARRVAAIRLAAFFGWSVQDVRECARRANDQQIIRNLRQLDQLMRVRVLAARSGMDAQTLFMMGTLPASVDEAVYRQTADHALLSLSDTSAPLIPAPDDAQEQTVKLTCVLDNSDVVAGKPDQVATYTVTLTDLENTPLSGVNVYWQASLGSIDTVATNPSGVAEAKYRPGKAMGTDTPLYWLDLHPKQSADPVHLIADATTLDFPTGYRSPPPSGTVPVGQEVELYAMLKDQFNNFGRGMLVTWAGTPQAGSPEGDVLRIRPSSTFTDEEGYTRVFVSSTTGGTFEVAVTSQASDKTAILGSITFARPE